VNRGAPLTRRTGLSRTAWMKPPTCCGKKRYATEQAAQIALNRIGTTTTDAEYPRSAYECPQGWWHLTKQQPQQTKTARYTGPDRSVREQVWERDQGRCAVCGQGGLPMSIHHRRNRGSGGSSDPAINLPSNLLLVCDGPGSCHSWIGDHPRLAGDAGYVVGLNSIADPATVRVSHAVHGRVLLADDGTWSAA
jgi:hypothetical protein